MLQSAIYCEHRTSCQKALSGSPTISIRITIEILSAVGHSSFTVGKRGRKSSWFVIVNYWGNGKQGIDQPYLDRLKFRVVNNMDAALVSLKSGGLDYMEALQPVQHVRGTNSARFNQEFKKYEYYAPTYTYIGWNNDHPIFR